MHLVLIEFFGSCYVHHILNLRRSLNSGGLNWTKFYISKDVRGKKIRVK